MTFLMIVLFFVAISFISNSFDNIEREENESMGRQRTYGKYRVLYNDGKLSQPMNHTTAKNYAEIFGGKVIPR